MWITHSAGVARALAEWLVDGQPSTAVHGCDLNRFEAVQLAPAYVHTRSCRSFSDVTGGTCCIGLWGPAARALLQPLTSLGLSSERFGYFRARRGYVGDVPVTALRLSYVGELGWELCTSADAGARLWDTLWQAGQAHGVIAAGRGAFNSPRLEKGYRAWGVDMTAEHDPYEAGLGFAVRTAKEDFVGRDGLAARAAAGPRRKPACLVIDDPAEVVMGGEPVYVAGAPAGYVTSAAYGYTTGANIACGWLPAPAAVPGTRVEIDYFGAAVPAVVSEEPLFDPGYDPAA